MKEEASAVLLAVLGTALAAAAQEASPLKWRNPPPKRSAEGGAIAFDVMPKTDYWRTTHYGYVRDTGPFCFREATGDLVARVKVEGTYRELYDQAGLMIRIDAENWIKTGIEFVNGTQNVSTVVTRGFSDWSVVPLSTAPPAVWLELVRKADYVETKYSLDGTTWVTVREAYFPPGTKVEVGVMAAAPEGKGFPVRFEGFSVTAAGP
jgi:regulation of enolase protein 1 (concanavalin A-like superfamily)